MPRPIYDGPELDDLREKFSWETRQKVSVLECPICHKTPHWTITTEERYGLPVSAKMCDYCGMIYLDPVLSAKEYEEFYTGWYHNFVRAYRREPCGPKHYIRKGFILGKQIGDYLKQVKLPKTLNVLDIGGSTGIVCRELRKKLEARGCVAKCTILDPSVKELEIAKSYGHKTICGLFEKVKLKEKYDFIIFARTSDHVLDPIGCLTRIRDLLTPTGCLYVDFVDTEHQSGIFGIPGCFHIDHTHNWNSTTAAWVLRKIGFEAVECEVYDGCWRFIVKKAEPVDEEPDKKSVEFLRRKISEKLRNPVGSFQIPPKAGDGS